ncbi:6686_t:CDS:2, partial [Acaulospora colombiana]
MLNERFRESVDSAKLCWLPKRQLGVSFESSESQRTTYNKLSVKIVSTFDKCSGMLALIDVMVDSRFIELFDWLYTLTSKSEASTPAPRIRLERLHNTGVTSQRALFQ